MIELDNCRWCGSDAKMETETSHLSKDPKPMYTVRCTSQYICSDLCYQCTSWYRSEKLAAKAWNARPISKHQQDIIKAAVKAMEDVNCEFVSTKTDPYWALFIKGEYCSHDRGTTVEVCGLCIVDHLAPHLEALKGLIDD